MQNQSESFFTVIGCMDGRCQEIVIKYGQEKFGSKYPDTITEAGMVKYLSQDKASASFLASLKKKITISLTNHNSCGIIIHGHQECAGNQVSDEMQKEHIRKSIKVVRTLLNKQVTIIGVFIHRNLKSDASWEIELISETLIA